MAALLWPETLVDNSTHIYTLIQLIRSASYPKMRQPTITLLIASTAAAVQVSYPLNAQIPPVAQVGQAFAFQFAATTFEPESDKLQYSISGNPSWLSLSAENRTLLGTPELSDVGSVSFKITAAGAGGAVADMPSNLVVKASAGPIVNVNISAQLQGAGNLSGPSSVTMLPAKPVDIKFPPDTFRESDQQNLSYYATLSDHTPLPSWLQFDPNTLHFTGRTPQITQSPQSFDVLLIASDEPNYTETSITFTLMVSAHYLCFSTVEQNVNVSKGNPVNFSGLRNQLLLDSTVISDTDLQSTSAQLPPWLSWDSQTFELKGDPPSGLMSQDVTITAKDRFGDEANTLIHFLFQSALFHGEIDQLNITTGQEYSYQIPSSVLAQENESVKMDFGRLGTWLQFDTPSLTIHGKAPDDVAGQHTQATLTATSSQNGAIDSQTFVIAFVAPEAPPQGARFSLAPSATASPSRDRSPSEDSRRRRDAVILGTVLPAVALLIVAFVFALCFNRARRAKKEQESSPRPEISRPIMPSDEWEDIDRTLEPDLEKGEGEAKHERTPEHPPQLVFKLPVHSAKRSQDSRITTDSLGDGEAKILAEFDTSSWGMKDESGSSHNPHDSMKIPTVMARQASPMSGTNSIRNRRRYRATNTNRDSYRDSYRSSGIPLNRRLTGLGHGRHSYSLSHMPSFSAGRRTRDSRTSSSYSTVSTGVLSTAPSACPCPQPSPARHTTQLTTPLEKRPSIRVVSESDSVPDNRTWDERRQSYIRKRASAQSPFFGGSASRVSSSSYKPPFAEHATSNPSQAATPVILTEGTSTNHFPEKTKLGHSTSPRAKSALLPLPYGSTNNALPTSLRKPPTPRSFVKSSDKRTDRVEKRHDRCSALGFPRPRSRRASSNGSFLEPTADRHSRSSLGNSKIFEDAELSESVYSTESGPETPAKGEDDTKRQTAFILPSLSLDPRRSSKTKRDSKDCKPAVKEPTPYSLLVEHGGKENRTSNHFLFPDTKRHSKTKINSTTSSPTRQSYHQQTSYVPPNFPSRSPSRTKVRTNRRSQHPSPTRRNSHRSSYHSQTSSRSHRSHPQSISLPARSKLRNQPKTQSSAYPHIEGPIFPIPQSPVSRAASPTKTPCHTRHHSRAQSQSQASEGSLIRSTSGHILDYGIHEDPKIYDIDDSSLGYGTSNGRVNSSARRSKLGVLAEQRRASSQGSSSVTGSSPPPVPPRGGSGLTPDTSTYGLRLIGGSLGRAEETPGALSSQGARTPLSVITGENMSSPAQARMVEGKGKRPVSVEVDDSPRSRRTWRSLRGVLSRQKGGVIGSEAFL